MSDHGRPPPRRRLTVEERQVLTHLRSAHSLAHIATLTGLPTEQVRGVLERLVEERIIRLHPRGVELPTAPARAPAPPRPAPGRAPVPAAELPPELPPEPPTAPELRLSAAREPALLESPPTEVGVQALGLESPPTEIGVQALAPESPPTEIGAQALAPESPPMEGGAQESALEAPPTEIGAQVPEAEPAQAQGEGEGEGEAEATPEPAQATVDTWRALFERQLRALPEEERMRRARTAVEPELSAYCFDVAPGVIRVLLDNPRLGLEHARLIARHHRNPVGLEALCGRNTFASNAGVRRWLVRNPQFPQAIFRRMWSTRGLLEQYLIGQDRDVPDSLRRAARELLRQRFQSTSADERVNLIFKTEGRVLTWLAGVAVDGKTASLLCARTIRSTLLVQNLARWSSAPPTVIAWLLKQDLVRRQPQLRQLLLRHPNAPVESRRGSAEGEDPGGGRRRGG